MKKELFYEYCQFMFPILTKLLSYVALEDDKYQHRAIAFLSERLTSFWFKHKKDDGLKIKEIPIEFIV